MLYSWIIKHEINWKVNMYEEAKRNIDILYQIVWKKIILSAYYMY